MTWTAAAIRAVAVFAYFAIATVWLPDFVLALGPIAEASEFLRDALLLIVWGGALGAGLWMLRRGQSRGVV